MEVEFAKSARSQWMITEKQLELIHFQAQPEQVRRVSALA